MRILVVEDNQKLAASLQDGLKQEGYVVDCIYDGISAEEQVSTFPDDYDLIILDIMLPGRDGITVCRNLRSQRVRVPVLMLTAKDTVRDRVMGLDIGADDYLIKPFSFDELTARIRALLRRPREQVPVILQAGPIELDTTTQEVRVNGSSIPLTLKEFRLLELLMRHPKQVLSREQILNSLWDYDADWGSNVIDVHVKNLRKKLFGTGKNDTIETIRGVGYRLKD
ncbi:MAG TPA: two-component system response regulator RppA [Spirochaetia bacterium]|nr:two-component system response regulator RppA [Spirochaetia bacterium]